MSQTLTVHDIARLAGVSAMTVSRALNHPEKRSPATLAKVQAVVQHTGFVPNGMAGGLRSSRAKLVAAVLPTLVGPVFQETTRALNAALDARGYQLMIGQSGYDVSREDSLLDAIIRRRPDGIVLTGIMHTPAGRRQLLASGIPVVETWDLTPTPIDMLVGFSNEEIGTSVCTWLHLAAPARLPPPGPHQRAGRTRPTPQCSLSAPSGPRWPGCWSARAAWTPCSAAPTCWRSA